MLVWEILFKLLPHLSHCEFPVFENKFFNGKQAVDQCSHPEDVHPEKVESCTAFFYGKVGCDAACDADAFERGRAVELLVFPALDEGRQYFLFIIRISIVLI